LRQQIDVHGIKERYESSLMPFTRSGKHYSIRAKRFCKTCRTITEQSTVSVRYRAPPEPTVPESYLKEYSWLCEQCHSAEIETKTVYEPTDKALIFNRLMRIQEDYDLLSVSISSLPNEIVFRARLPDFDMKELRAIQYKAKETGFIRGDELMKLQKAGFKRPSDVKPKPMPKQRSRLLARARESMFAGEPRSI
jgi:hypothetical protein